MSRRGCVTVCVVKCGKCGDSVVTVWCVCVYCSVVRLQAEGERRDLSELLDTHKTGTRFNSL